MIKTGLTIKKAKALLIQDKDAVHHLDKDKDSPLHYAAQLGDEQIAELMIVFKKNDETWTKTKYMGETFGDDALLTTMSPDGKYLFFTGWREGRKGVF